MIREQCHGGENHVNPARNSLYDQKDLRDENKFPCPVGSSPTHQSLRANRKYAGTTCAVCQSKIQLGDELRVCLQCKLPIIMIAGSKMEGGATMVVHRRNPANPHKVMPIS